MATDVSGIAGTTFGILGMGIGIGILAHTARGVTETMYGRRTYRRPTRYYSPRMKSSQFKLNRSYRPKTRARRRRPYYRYYY